MPSAKRPPVVAAVSPQDLQRMERKVDANRREMKAAVKRLDALNLNGSVTVLHALADAATSLSALAAAAPSLLALAEAAPSLIAEVEMKREDDAFWRGLQRRVKRYLHPLKPVGALIWLVVGGITTAVTWFWVGSSQGTPLHHP